MTACESMTLMMMIVGDGEQSPFKVRSADERAVVGADRVLASCIFPSRMHSRCTGPLTYLGMLKYHSQYHFVVKLFPISSSTTERSDPNSIFLARKWTKNEISIRARCGDEDN